MRDESTPPTTSTYLCIGCPLGCRLEVDEGADGEIVEVRGFACKRGDDYARQEHHAPQRTVTTTVAVSGARWQRLPVRSRAPVPKQMVVPICQALRTLQVDAPVTLGQTIASNILGSGVDIVAARTMRKRA